jgi:hypothetical protein
MSEIMSHREWMNITSGGIASVRSSELKAVDAALAKYDSARIEPNKQALLAALMKWMQSKGNAWKTSVRNRHQGVEILYAQLTGVGKVKITGKEMVGLSHVRDEGRAIINDLFRGKQLRWRSDFGQKLADEKWGVRVNVPSAVRSIKELAPKPTGAPSTAAKLADDLYKDLVPPEILGDVTTAINGILPQFMQDLAASLTPFVGVIASGGGAVWSTTKAIRGKWRLEWSQHHAAHSLAGMEPAAAFGALSRILDRELNNEIFGASVSLADFGGKLAGVLADGGTATNAAVGLATAVVKLMNIIRIIVRDVVERNEANRRMAGGLVDRSIFGAAPIVGAYMICCVPASVLASAIFEDAFGQPGWQSRVEHAVATHHGPLKEQARRVVQAHRFWIPELQNSQGFLEVNKKKLEAMLERKGKSGMEGFGSDNLPPELQA